MILFLRLLKESLSFALNQLKVNKLRTILSLLGITIGIFAIISVFTIIDSMERSIRDSIATLGSNVVYVQKWPWSFGGNYPWWKYMNRPQPSLDDHKAIEERARKVKASAFIVSTSRTVYYHDNYAENNSIVAATHDYHKIRDFELSKGRYFSYFESKSGKNKAILGADLAKDLFRNIDPVGKDIKVAGRKAQVIGIFKKEGEDMFNSSMDNTVFLPLNYVKNFFDIKSGRLNPFIMIEAEPGITNAELKDELRRVLRSAHRLKPMAEDDFALNEASLLSQGFTSIFSSIDLAGWIIGGFSILVGGFGIANIMFVSVKERTSIIGIQKALGAKRYFVLFEFLYEAVILSIIGGGVGLLLIFIGTKIFNGMIDMDFALSVGNVIMGLVISGIIGVISGFAPALKASKLNPVEAISATG